MNSADSQEDIINKIFFEKRCAQDDPLNFYDACRSGKMHSAKINCNDSNGPCSLDLIMTLTMSALETPTIVNRAYKISLGTLNYTILSFKNNTCSFLPQSYLASVDSKDLTERCSRMYKSSMSQTQSSGSSLWFILLIIAICILALALIGGLVYMYTRKKDDQVDEEQGASYSAVPSQTLRSGISNQSNMSGNQSGGPSRSSIIASGIQSGNPSGIRSVADGANSSSSKHRHRSHHSRNSSSLRPKASSSHSSSRRK